MPLRRPLAATLTAAVVVAALAGCAAPKPRLPQGFPSAVPVIAGRVLAAKHEYGEWYVWIRSAHPVADYVKARALLLKAGFDEGANDESPGGSVGQFCTPRWCAGLTGYHDPRYGDSVSYEVFPPSGMTTPG